MFLTTTKPVANYQFSTVNDLKITILDAWDNLNLQSFVF